MSKALELIRTLIDGANEYEKKTGNTNPTVYLSRNNLLIIQRALNRLESIDNAEPSEALECLERIGAEKLARGELIRNDDKVEPYLNTIKQALLNAEQPKHYLKWEDLEFSYGTKTQKVRMVDTIYKIVYANYDNTKEVQLLSEDEKCYYIGFTGNYKDNVQLFNDLHLERVEE